jgi:hypothetical protein
VTLTGKLLTTFTIGAKEDTVVLCILSIRKYPFRKKILKKKKACMPKRVVTIRNSSKPENAGM